MANLGILLIKVAMATRTWGLIKKGGFAPETCMDWPVQSCGGGHLQIKVQAILQAQGNAMRSLALWWIDNKLIIYPWDNIINQNIAIQAFLLC